MATGTSTTFYHPIATALAGIRTIVGVSCLGSPAFASSFVGINMNSGSRILAKLFGARECALAVLLWWAHCNASAEGSRPQTESKARIVQVRRDLRIILWTGVLIDAVDSFSSAMSISEGSMTGKAIWLAGAGAVALAGMGGLALRTM